MAKHGAQQDAQTQDQNTQKRNEQPREKPRGRHKVDWEAVERDYRTGHFTLRELEAKHGVSYAQISRKSKEHAWTKDLREVIKQATDAALLRETVTEAQKDVTETVLVAAEMNTRVIRAHRKDLSDARAVAAGMLAELQHCTPADQDAMVKVLAGEGAEPADLAAARARVQRALSLGVRISCIKQLSDTFDKLQVAERRAFGLDDKTERQPSSLADMATDELKRMREALLNGG